MADSTERAIGINMWNDPEMRDVSGKAKFLLWYFITTPHGFNDLGLYLLRPAYAITDLDCTPEDYDLARAELQERALISYDDHMGMIFVKNFLKYYPAKSQNHAIRLKKAFDALPDSQLKGEFLANMSRPEIIGENRNDMLRRLCGGEKIDGTTAGLRWGTKDPLPNLSPEAKGMSGLMDAWNHICKPAGLPGVSEATPKRKEKGKSRLAEHPIEWWIQIFKTITITPFLCGTNDRGWKANFDWILNTPDNALALQEGKYGGLAPITRPAPGPVNTKNLWGRCPECQKETLKTDLDKYGSCQTCFKPLSPEKTKELFGTMLSGIGKEIPSGRAETGNKDRGNDLSRLPRDDGNLEGDSISRKDASESPTGGTGTGEAEAVDSEFPGPEAGDKTARDHE